MKRLLYILIILLFLTIPSNAQMMSGNGYSGGEYIHTNGFETQADDDDWTNESGTPDYDYSTNPIAGSEMCELGSVEYASILITNAADVYVSIAIKWDDTQDDAENELFFYDNGGSNILGYAQVTADGTVKVKAGSTGTLSGASSTAIDDGSVHYILMRYQKGSGADSRIDYWHWNGSAWNDNVNSTDGNATTNAEEFHVRNTCDTEKIYFDQYKEKATSINDPT